MASSFLARIAVSRVWELTPRIRAYALRPDTPLSFLAGQQLEIHLPQLNSNVVGSYPLFTSPREYAREGELNIAVLASRHPAARWMHDKCIVGTKLAVKVAGNHTFHPSTTSPNLLLVAGGMGAAPIFSIAKEASTSPKVKQCVILQSARHQQEFLFEHEINKLVADSKGRIQVMRFVTRIEEHTPSHTSTISTNPTPPHIPLHRRRLTSADVQSMLNSMSNGPLANFSLDAFVSGPPGMMDAIAASLKILGVPRSALKFDHL